MKKVAILQSNYIPWKGYFDLIAAVDEFIIYDEMQFTKNDWRNRNKIKTPQGVQWLTIPVGQNISRQIAEVKLKDPLWQVKHWKTLESNYHRAQYFEEITEILKPLYLQKQHTYLSVLNKELIKVICLYLGIKTKISDSKDYRLIAGKSVRLVDLCLQAKATEYISGPAARDYIEEDLFLSQNIQLTWFDYTGYPQYPQLWGEFIHQVSILDLLFNCGRSAPNYMRYIQT